MNKPGTAQVILPSILFTFIMHAVYDRVFMADLNNYWLLLILGIQALLFAGWAFEKVSANFTITGAALAALIIDSFTVTRGALDADAVISPAFIGAAVSSLLIIAALYTSYRLASSAGYWFEPLRRQLPNRAPHRKGTTPPARPLPAKEPSVSSQRRYASMKSDPLIFRIFDSRAGEQIASLPASEVGRNLHIKKLKSLLPDYEPDTIQVVQVTWHEGRAVDIHVNGELKGAAKEHYTVLEMEE